MTMINVTQSPMTVADYCQAYVDKKIIVNRDYQRSWGVWPAAARSFLIESIILGYPVPKFSLHQVLDLKSRKTFKEIVDGQQRTAAIVEFFTGELQLSGSLDTEELAGKSYDDLDQKHQQAFLSYPIAIDLFIGTAPEEIREVFRRMNSYTVPLNPEEERHAFFQGQFKWYIYRLARSVEGVLADSGVMSQRGFVRMQDAKLLTEITHALHHEIKTTNKKHLSNMYDEFDKEFEEQREYRDRLKSAFLFLGELDALHNGLLMRGYIIYSLMLAVTHLLDPIDHFQEIYAVEGPKEIVKETALADLQRLEDALDQKEDYQGPLESFVEACVNKTNVKAQRETRMLWLCRALEGHLPVD